MDTLDKLIAEIRGRPALYLGGNSIERLSAFVRGWSVARNRADDSKVLAAFQGWVSDKYGITTTQHWERIIRFFCMDENEALDQFFELYDEFRASS